MLMSKILPKVKNIVFILSFVLIAGIGLTYMILSDFLLSNAAIWLLITTVFSIGSSACIILSANYKEKPVTMYILIGAAILCAILFIVTIYSFAQMPLSNDITVYNEDGTKYEKSKSAPKTKNKITQQSVATPLSSPKVANKEAKTEKLQMSLFDLMGGDSNEN